jgi:pimeloyl-[acyl-carrier protein] methyl ester esterase
VCKALVCLASNLSFVQRDGWPDAMPEQVLSAVSNCLCALARKDPAAVLRLYKLRAVPIDPMAMTKLLRTQVHCRPSLAMGLDWLARLDLRADLAAD